MTKLGTKNGFWNLYTLWYWNKSEKWNLLRETFSSPFNHFTGWNDCLLCGRVSHLVVYYFFSIPRHLETKCTKIHHAVVVVGLTDWLTLGEGEKVPAIWGKCVFSGVPLRCKSTIFLFLGGKVSGHDNIALSWFALAGEGGGTLPTTPLSWWVENVWKKYAIRIYGDRWWLATVPGRKNHGKSFEESFHLENGVTPPAARVFFRVSGLDPNILGRVSQP